MNVICGNLRNLRTIKKDVTRLCGEHKSISTAGKTAGVQGTQRSCLMKTKRFFLFGLLAVLLALGLVLAGCGDDEDDPVAKSVTITGIPDNAFTGASSVSVWLIADMTEENSSPVALRSGNISEGTLTVALTVPTNGTYESNTRWTGSGSYYVGLLPIINGSISSDDAYVYVGEGGQAPAQVAFADATATVSLAFTSFLAFSGE
jgi:hypothetical protein